jgi:hypothetical protein
LKRVLPAAAAIAVATVNAANVQMPEKAQAGHHKDVTELAVELQQKQAAEQQTKLSQQQPPPAPPVV